jgi:hypothetical protein
MTNDIRALLEAPFQEIQWKIQTMSKDSTKGMVVGYIDARDVAARLDSVGVTWSDSYTVLQMASTWVVECRLTVDGITRTDVGTGDGEESAKSAYSDAFKRAAVKFGIGRYLYDLPTSWVAVENRQITKDAMASLHAAYNRLISKQAITAPVPAPKPAAEAPAPVQEFSPAPAAKPISDAQIKLLAIALKQMGFESTTPEDKADTRSFIAWLLQLPSLPSIKDLSMQQATKVLYAIGNRGEKFELNEDAAGKLYDDWIAYRAQQEA